MRIVADENIPLVKEFFSLFGEVSTLPGRTISRNDLSGAEILLVRSVTRVDETLLHNTGIRFVGSATIGVDHVDLEYLQKNGIGFAYAPGSNSESVAEYIVAALMDVARRKNLRLDSLTLGIIGVGNIGSRVLKHAVTLGMRTLLCDPPKKRAGGGEIYRSLAEVLDGSDIVSLHVPLITAGEDRTENMVDESFLCGMKNGAILINTSRGRVANEKALLNRRNRLGGLVLDVWNNEPYVDTELVSVADIATPHIAGYSFEGKIRGTIVLYETACRFFSVKPENLPCVELPQEPAADLCICDSFDPVSDAVLQAYPIEDDDRRFREIVTLPKKEQPYYFDRLRKEYPRRYEFSHFRVYPENCSFEAIEQLKKLGFGIVSNKIFR